MRTQWRVKVVKKKLTKTIKKEMSKKDTKKEKKFRDECEKAVNVLQGERKLHCPKCGYDKFVRITRHVDIIEIIEDEETIRDEYIQEDIDQDELRCHKCQTIINEDEEFGYGEYINGKWVKKAGEWR